MRQLTVFLLCGLVACSGGGSGSDGGSNGPGNSAPTISNLNFGPSIVEVGFDGGETSVIGTFDFHDADGNLSSVTLVVLDANGQTIGTDTIAIVGVAGITDGTIEGEIIVGTTDVGDFTIRVNVTDTGGLRSNTLEALFRIVEPAWVLKTPMPNPRLGFATTMVGGIVYVLGGRDPTSGSTPAPQVATVQTYNPATNIWSTAPSMPIAVSEHAAATVNGKIYVIGGNTEFELGSVGLQVFDTATQTWSQKASMPMERDSAAVGVINGLIYIAGGEGPGVTYNSLLWYNPVTNTWTTGTPMSEVRTGAGGAIINGKFIVYGGYTPMWIPDAGYRRVVESYDPVMDNWSFRTEGGPLRDFGMCIHGGLMYVFGGNNWARSTDGSSAYDHATDTWHYKQVMPVSMGYARAETVNDKIYVFDSTTTLEYTPANDLN